MLQKALYKSEGFESNMKFYKKNYQPTGYKIVARL